MPKRKPKTEQSPFSDAAAKILAGLLFEHIERREQEILKNLEAKNDNGKRQG